MNKGKLLKGMALLGAIAALSGCNDTGLLKEAKFTEGLDSIVLENDRISLKFMKDNGSLTSIVNQVTKTDYVKDTVGGNWAMMVDTSTNDPFLSNPSGNSTKLVSSRNSTMSYSSRKLDDGYELTLSFPVKVGNSSGITVIETITLKDGDEEASFSYRVINSLSNSVVVSFTAAEISGIKEGGDDYTLFWPYNEGKLYEEAVDMVKTATDSSARMTMVYPVPSSLQLIQLYNTKESLFYYVEDSTREFKEFNFGCFTNRNQYDYQGVTAIDKVSMSATQYPFVKTGEEKDLHTVKIGTGKHGDYYDGSNHYRKFLKENMSREFTDTVKDWTGFTALVGSYYGNRHFASYTQAIGFDTHYSKWATSVNQYGIYSTAILGWHEGGFDSNYPDYEFIAGEGFGEAGFRSAMSAASADGNLMMPYINLHIADVASKWSKVVADAETGITNIQRCAVKYKGFTSDTLLADYPNYMQLETYGTATSYYAMCPKAKAFQDAIIDACTRLRTAGCGGFWFDQLMQMPANLCFDKSHGHRTPATAMAEGYKELFDRLEAVMAEGPDYVLACEGVCDAYIEYVDCCGYLWSRKLGARDTGGDGHNMSPEITRFTMPAKFLGIEGAGTTTASDDEFARAFVMCDPFLGDPYKPSVGVWTSLYNSDSTYLRGAYIDMMGLNSTNDEFIYGGCLSEDGKKLIVNIYNYSTEASSGDKVTVDLERLDLSGKSIKSAIDMRLGGALTASGSTVSLPSVDVNGVASILINIA